METDSTVAPVGRPLIIPVFIPHLGCPHRCVFCNQRAITGRHSAPPADRIRMEVNRYLKFARKRFSTIQLSFFGGNFLGIEREAMRVLLRTATDFVERGVVDSLRFSTRPDTISAEALEILTPFPVSTVELGVQSMNDAVLAAARRGHSRADIISAASRLKDRGYRLGLQMMVGLPGDDDRGALQTARRIARLAPDFVRIYPTLVLAGSPLEKLFRAGAYRPMPLDRCISLVKRLFLFFKSNAIPVVRMGLQASDGLADDDTLIAGPYHPAFGHLVHGEITLDAIRAAIDGRPRHSRYLTIVAHPAMVSRVQGLNKRNISCLRAHCRTEDIRIVQDNTIARNRLLVDDRPVSLDI